MILRHHYRGGAFRGGGNVFARWEEIEDRLRDIAAQECIRAVGGHLTFGLAERLLPDSRYIAILRDPVERTLSHHHVLFRSRPDRVPGPGVQRTGLIRARMPPAPPGLTVAEAIAPRGYILDNLQTRMLCGLESPYEDLPGDALDHAKAILRERFAYVGTTERFDEFLALLNIDLGWPAMAMKRSRRYEGRTRREDLSADDLRLIEERNLLDRDLHAYAGDLLGATLDAAAPELASEVEVIREATRRFAAEQPVLPAEVRALPVEARVALALGETALARSEVQARKLAKKVKKRSSETLT
jgi:hypothetical protein